MEMRKMGRKDEYKKVVADIDTKKGQKAIINFFDLHEAKGSWKKVY